MNSPAIPELEQLQQSARELADLLISAAPGVGDLGLFPEESLLQRVRAVAQLQQQARESLHALLKQSLLPAPPNWRENSWHENLQLVESAHTLNLARQLWEEYYQKLHRSNVTDQNNASLLADLRQIEALLDAPTLPLTDELIDFAAHYHPLQSRIEQACQDALHSSTEPETEDSASPLESPTGNQTAGPADDSVAQQSEFRDQDDTASDSGDPFLDAEELQELDRLFANHVDEVADALSADPFGDRPSAAESHEFADDLIFDDFATEPREKRILTAAELSQGLDQLEQQSLSKHDEPADATARNTAAPPDNSPTVSAESPVNELPISQDIEQELLRKSTPVTSRQDAVSNAEADGDSVTAVVDWPTIQRLAAKAAGVSNRFDRVSSLSQLIWELIEQGEYCWAYQVSRCLYANLDEDLQVPAPPPWLLELLVLGDSVKFSSGRVAREFQRVLEQHRQEALKIAEQGDSPAAFLLRACLMRGAITAPSGVAADILRTYVIQPDQTQLYNYCSRIASFSSRARGLKLDQYFHRPGAASIEAEASEIRARAVSWKTERFEQYLPCRVTLPLFSRSHWSLHSGMAARFPERIQVWRARQVLQTHIIRLLEPILENRLMHSTRMEADLKRLAECVQLAGQETHVILASRESIRLPGQADYNYVQEAIEFGSHWLMLAASQPGIENALVPQEVNELRDEIDRRQATVFRELQQLQRTHAAAPQRAALTACRRSMDRIHQLFHPTQEQRLEEADPACLMNAELLKIPGVSVEEDWTCATPPGALEHRILEQLSAGPVSWEEAFTQQLQSHSHHSAHSLLQLDVWTEDQRQTLQKNLEQSHCAHAETLREQVRSISLRIEESQQIEMLPPQEAQELATRLNTLESRISRGGAPGPTPR